MIVPGIFGCCVIFGPYTCTVNDFFSPRTENDEKDGFMVTAIEVGMCILRVSAEFGEPTLANVLLRTTLTRWSSSMVRQNEG